MTTRPRPTTVPRRDRHARRRGHPSSPGRAPSSPARLRGRTTCGDGSRSRRISRRRLRRPPRQNAPATACPAPPRGTYTGAHITVVRRRSDHRLVAVVDLRGLPSGTYSIVVNASGLRNDRARPLGQVATAPASDRSTVERPRQPRALTRRAPIAPDQCSDPSDCRRARAASLLTRIVCAPITTCRSHAGRVSFRLHAAGLPLCRHCPVPQRDRAVAQLRPSRRATPIRPTHKRARLDRAARRRPVRHEGAVSPSHVLIVRSDGPVAVDRDACFRTRRHSRSASRSDRNRARRRTPAWRDGGC